MFNIFVYMKKIAILSSLLAMLMSASSASAQNPPQDTVVLKVNPKMTYRNCENKIKTNVRFEKGVKGINADVNTNTVTIKYDTNVTDVDRLIAALKKIGYEAKPHNADN